jgi:hypothetical protein
LSAVNYTPTGIYLLVLTNILMKNLLVLLLLAGASLCHAQAWEGGLYAGASVYSGDLSPKVIPHYANFANAVGGLMLRYRGDGIIGARLSLNYTRIEGDDARSAHPQRQLSFNSRLMEASLMAEWFMIRDNFLGDEPPVTPYLLGGLTVFHFNPYTQLNGFDVELQPLGTEGQGLEGYEEPYRRTQLAIPFGAGIKFKLDRRSALSFEITGRKLFTDYLDDVSGEVVDYSVIYEEKGGETAQASLPSVDPNSDQPPQQYFRRGGSRMDAYFMIGLGYTYKLSRW